MRINLGFFIFLLFTIDSQSYAQRKDAWVDIGSLLSLKIYSLKDKDTLASGTGFIIRKDGVPYLITNLHNVTGIDYWNGKFFDSKKRTPNTLIIEHHLKDRLGNWISKKEHLYSGITKRWNDLKIDGNIMDVISLRLSDTVGISIYPINLNNSADAFRFIPGTQGYVIGYPFGISASKQYPVWKTVFTASELDDNYLELPVFLIDGTTRRGMSGSPVILTGDHIVVEKATKKKIEVTTDGYYFIGIFSGHIDAMELGAVFKVEVISELIKLSK